MECNSKRKRRIGQDRAENAVEPSEAAIALTAEQQELVRRHMGLIGVHLRLRVPTPRNPQRQREYDDLFQEGCVALIQAAARYDPRCNGEFAAYACLRIRSAVFQAIHNRFTLVHVPARARIALRSDPNRPKPPAHVMDINDELEESMTVEQTDSQPRETIRHVIRRRYEWAVRQVLTRMRQRVWRKRNPCEIMTCIAEQRLLISSERLRIPMRQIASDFNISCSRINSFARRLELEVKEAFRADPQVQALLRMARQADEGRDAVMDAERWATLRQAQVADFEERFLNMAPAVRAETMYSLIERSSHCVPEVARNLYSLTLNADDEPTRTVA